MTRIKLLIDNDVIIDYLNEREPYYEKARLLMLGGCIGEFDLWISSSQVTDLVHILSDGGRSDKFDSAADQLRGLRTFVNVFATSARELDIMLAGADCDPTQYLLYEIALALRADVFIVHTHNQFITPRGSIPVMDCDGFFEWMKEERGLDYDEMAL